MNAVKIILGIILLIPCIVCLIVGFVFYINFNISCGEHMMLASVANNIELATKEMTIVVEYAEYNNLTSGSVSVLYESPSNDVGFWYKNMTAALEELRSVKPEASELEKSNVLMKLRETLEHSTPNAYQLSRFPHNVLWFWATTLPFAPFILGLYLILRGLPD